MNYQYANGTFGPRIVNKSAWTDEIDAWVIVLILEKLSSAQIAADVNKKFGTVFSRCSVIGRISRQKLGRLYTSPRKNTADAALTQRIRRPVVKLRHKIIPIDQQSVSREIDDQQIPIEQRCTLMQLDAHTCRWPIGDALKPDFFFCGDISVDGRPYCASHCARAFQPANDRRDKRFSAVVPKWAA